MAALKVYTPSVPAFVRPEIRRVIGITGVQADVHIVASSRDQAAALADSLIRAMLPVRDLRINHPGDSARMIELAGGPGVFVAPMLSRVGAWLYTDGADGPRHITQAELSAR